MGICALYMLALGNLGSVRYPRGLSGERVAHGGRGFQGFLFLIYPVALAPGYIWRDTRSKVTWFSGGFGDFGGNWGRFLLDCAGIGGEVGGE